MDGQTISAFIGIALLIIADIAHVFFRFGKLEGEMAGMKREVNLIKKIILDHIKEHGGD